MPRPTGRVLLVDTDGRVLLFAFRDAMGGSGRFWATPGGRLRAGEAPVDASARELYEETGCAVAPGKLAGPVARCRGTWSDGQCEYAADDQFFFARCRRARVDASRREKLERSLILGHHWWGVDELDASAEVIRPTGLAALLRRLLAGGVPTEPLELPWR